MHEDCKSGPVFWHHAGMPVPLLIQFLLCPLVLISLLWVTAPYGRHHRSGWGPSLPNRAAWFWMELPAVLIIALLVLSRPEGREPAAWVPLLLWEVHYGYRTLLFPAWMRAGEKSFPALLVLFAVAFNGLNGYNNADALLDAGAARQPLQTLHFFLGSLLFVGGFILHVHSDRTIRRLRGPGETGYRIPHGGGFRWVGSPHYLGEIIQWTGWAILTWSAAGLAFALFTFCNLAPRAVANHRWYRETFADYPRERRVLVPGLF
jgi:protein-S-isoprenylcysteine O-methyltransferase Ste14